MDTPGNLSVSSAPTTAAKFAHAAGQLDKVSLLALFATALGWFFMDTLVVSLGSLQRGVRFFDLASAIADPTRIFFGFDAPLQRLLFGLLCVACLSAPLFAHWRSSRPAWLGYLPPLVLMVVCGALLFSRTSSEFFAAPSDAASLSAGVIRFANHLARQGSALVSRHVSIGAGGYLAFTASVILAAQGMRHFRRHA